jgi:hypothetical protein
MGIKKFLSGLCIGVATLAVGQVWAAPAAFEISGAVLQSDIGDACEAIRGTFEASDNPTTCRGLLSNCSSLISGNFKDAIFADGSHCTIVAQQFQCETESYYERAKRVAIAAYEARVIAACPETQPVPPTSPAQPDEGGSVEDTDVAPDAEAVGQAGGTDGNVEGKAAVPDAPAVASAGGCSMVAASPDSEWLLYLLLACPALSGRYFRRESGW